MDPSKRNRIKANSIPERFPSFSGRPSSHFKTLVCVLNRFSLQRLKGNSHSLQENKWCVFCKSVYAARHKEFSRAHPSKLSTCRLICLKIAAGRLSHIIFHCILLHLLSQHSFLVVLSRYLCKITLYFANYYAGSFGPDCIVQNWYRRHPAQMLYQSFPAPAQGHTEFCRLAHFPQAANRRLSLPKVSAAAALLQTVHCVCRLKLSTSRTRGPAQ